MADQYGPYNERIAGRSPNTGGFSNAGGGRWIRKIIVGDKGDGLNAITDIGTLHNIVREILGTTVKHEDGYRIRRELPKALPEFPWLYADRISDIVGIGRPTKTTSPVTQLTAGPWDEFALYPGYELTVECIPLAYPLDSDDNIRTDSLTWTFPDGTTNWVKSIGGTVNGPFTYAKEWYRFTTFERAPSAEWITAEAGQFQFDVNSSEDPDGFNASKGQIKQLVPQGALKVTWHRVPSAFVDTTTTDTYVQAGLGHINQNEWAGHPAGTLLYTAVSVNRYQPPIPDFAYFLDSANIAPQLLCDIQFIFLERDPHLGKDALGNTATPSAPPNANAIQKGWNLQPLAHMGSWYYAMTTGITGFTDANNKPAFPSFPFELLFTNPGV